MGMSLNNGNISVQSSAVAKNNKNSFRNQPQRAFPSDKTLDINSNRPELPPIGIKPKSPSYSSSPTSRGPYGSPLELNIGLDGVVKRTRRSPLSPTSTISSQEGSLRSNRLSPAGGLHRSRTWNGDLSNNQQGNNKLETLYEGTTGVEAGVAKLSIVQEGKLELKESKTIASTITSPPPIDSHVTVKSSQTLTLITPSQPLDTRMGASQLPATPITKTPQLTVNKLSQENLKKHRNVSQSSSSSLKANSDTGYDTDEDKDQRIVQWLIGVETSHTEQPPDSAIDTTNEKRDTAIHIVYEGD